MQDVVSRGDTVQQSKHVTTMPLSVWKETCIIVRIVGIRLEKMRLESQEKQVKLQVESREDVQAHEIEKIVVKAVEDRKTALLVNQSQVEEDVDNDGDIDMIDIAKLNIEKEKLNILSKYYFH